MTSLHTFLYTQYGFVLRGLCLSPSVRALCQITSESVVVHDVACRLAHLSRAVNAAD